MEVSYVFASLNDGRESGKGHRDNDKELKGSILFKVT